MILALLTFAAAWLFTAQYLPLARRWRQLDEPNARSAHLRPVPSSGGIAVIAALSLTLTLGRLTGQLALAPRELWALCIAVLLCIAGARDDRRPLSVRLRLPLFLALGELAAGLYLWRADGTDWFLLAAVGLAVAWLVNLFNFMDGIDGLAALQCVLVALGLAGLGWLGQAGTTYIGTALAVAAAYTAFLGFNWPPARLFMGDAGSLSGGYLLGWLGLWGWREGCVSAEVWLALMSPFLIDTGYTLARRLLRGAPITEAHSEHIYQQLARCWASHRRVDLALCLLQVLWLLPLAWLGGLGVLPGPGVLLLAVLPQLLALARFVAQSRRMQ